MADTPKTAEKTEKGTRWRAKSAEQNAEKDTILPPKKRKVSEIAGKQKTASKKAAPIVKSDDFEPLSAKQSAFVDEYLVDLNATQALIRAGYSAKTAGVVANQTLKIPKVAHAIAERQKDRLKRVELDQDRIVKELWNVVTADANELIEYRRTCCRYCWGEGFKYQRTASEMQNDQIQYAKDLVANEEDDDAMPLEPFDEAGGIGYDKRLPPHEGCTECFAEGVGSVFVKDTRNLSPAARSMYAGVKQTKEGLEIKMHDKQGSMQLLMRHAGMLNDKLRVHADPEDPMALLLAQLAGKTFKPVP